MLTQGQPPQKNQKQSWVVLADTPQEPFVYDVQSESFTPTGRRVDEVTEDTLDVDEGHIVQLYSLDADGAYNEVTTISENLLLEQLELKWRSALEEGRQPTSPGADITPAPEGPSLARALRTKAWLEQTSQDPDEISRLQHEIAGLVAKFRESIEAYNNLSRPPMSPFNQQQGLNLTLCTGSPRD